MSPAHVPPPSSPPTNARAAAVRPPHPATGAADGPAGTVPAAGRLGELWHFGARAIRNFDRSAALLPSSRYLARAMVEPLNLRDARVVVEFGAGTGAMTRALLAAMPPEARLFSFELDPTLHAYLTEHVRDARLHAINANATDVTRTLAAAGLASCDALLSSVGLSLQSEETRRDIWRSALSVLRPDSIATQFAYVHTKYLVLNSSLKASRFDATEFLEGWFDDVEGRYVWPNFPPAVAYTLRGPKPHGAAADRPSPGPVDAQPPRRS